MFTIVISIFYIGILGILLNRLHLLSILLCLELLMVSLFIGFVIISANLANSLLLSNNLILLTLSACEASAGLSLMVALSRTHNSDLVSSINILQQ
ncbi:NADH dehydrogenase subunit 4L (mitochondrion) [Asterias amurensis]|uniref:NADH-ubiquinone oxidoreductase chain 4L n=1 Tax=Asterias amurensis TaxID=7602 RepID=Q5KSR7_ASTAM|nr:NADH dehydrogenase subunit 4L [Asterias amurensis]BAD86686.1 NADH dehydrogenase subunit 4L [Asterias amurensis]